MKDKKMDEICQKQYDIIFRKIISLYQGSLITPHVAIRAAKELGEWSIYKYVKRNNYIFE